MFKFAIGEEVTLVAMLSPWPRLPIVSPPLPLKMVVVERMFRECYAEAQRLYTCRMYDLTESGRRVGIHRDLFTITEPELVSWTTAMAEHQAAVDAARTAH